MSTNVHVDEADHGPGLWQRTYANGERVITNIRLAGDGRRAGSGMINTATALLFMLGVGLFAVSLNAQFRYVFAEKHVAGISLVEALALDVGMAIFSLLALGLARCGKSARVERALILACAAGSALMNYAASDVSSPRSVLAYVMPPIFLAIVVDRCVAVVRRHVLGDEEHSPWITFGRGALYATRFAMAPPSTAKGLRQAVLQATPLPAAGPASESGIRWHPLQGADTPEKLEHRIAAIADPELRPQGRPRSHRKTQAPSKTSQFLEYIATEYGNGAVANIKPEAVYGLARDCGPKFDLHIQSAGNALRDAIKRARGDA